MTAVQWLIEELIIRDRFVPESLEQQAIKMEKQQIIDAIEDGRYEFGYEYYRDTYGSNGSDDHIVDTNEMVSSQTEILDEEIEQYAKQNAFNYYEFITGAKWYREQLKK